MIHRQVMHGLTPEVCPSEQGKAVRASEGRNTWPGIQVRFSLYVPNIVFELPLRFEPELDIASDRPTGLFPKFISARPHLWPAYHLPEFLP
jgi:hypothetical protein